MDIRNFRYFAEIARAQSFSKAAAALHRSQPGLSRAIQELEAELGIQLFSRSGRSVLLTQEGRELLVRVHSLLEQYEATTDYARMLASGKTLTLRVGAGATLIERALPTLLAVYKKQWSKVEVLLRSDGAVALTTALELGEIDIAVTRYVQNDLLKARAIFPTHIVAVLHKSHPLASKKRLLVEELNRQNLLVPPLQFSSRALINRAFAAAHIRPRIVLESVDLNTLISLARVGEGIALVPSTVLMQGKTTLVLPLFLNTMPLGWWTALVWNRRQTLPPHVRAFIEEAAKLLEVRYPGRELALPGLSRRR